MKKPKLYKQEKNYSCTVACLRMVLEYYGIKEDEKSLRIKTKTKPYGTHPINAIRCAESYKLKATISSLNLDKLRKFINQNKPVITNILKYSDNEFYVHSVVVYRIENDIINILDPEDGEIYCQSDMFELLWKSTEYTSIIIEKP